MTNYQKYRQTSLECSKSYYQKNKKGTDEYRKYVREKQRFYRMVKKLELKPVENPLMVRIKGQLIKSPFQELNSENKKDYREWCNYMLNKIK